MFDKDAWILRAIAAGVIRPREDGTIWRPGNLGLEQVKVSTHKATGRIFFNLSFEKIRKSVLVNRVIGLAFIPNPLGLPEVNHIDGVKAHNWKTNLEWASRSDQEKHAFATGLKSARGSNNGNAKLTAADVVKIRQAPIASLDELAISLNVSRKCIADIRARRTWKHL